ncbi:hypothetical protein [Cyclobacterium qasimii]|nr:hypothetical protein [Cyclobacterium qasimii]
MKHITSALLFLFIAISSFGSSLSKNQMANPFLGMWGLEVEGGGVGWLHVNEDQGFLDAELLWIGGSVLPVSNVYLADENTLVVTRTNISKKSDERSHTITNTLRIVKTGNTLKGTMSGPRRDGEYVANFTGFLMPTMPAKPDLSKVTYGKSIALFNEKT